MYTCSTQAKQGSAPGQPWEALYSCRTQNSSAGSRAAHRVADTRLQGAADERRRHASVQAEGLQQTA